MNWRAWAYNLLVNDQEVLEAIGHSQGDPPIYQSGSLQEVPSAHRFLVVVFVPSTPGPFPGSYIERIQVWAHDKSRGYTRIDSALRAVQKSLEKASSEEEFIKATWEGDSQDMQDDAMRTFTRYALFRIAGGRKE